MQRGTRGRNRTVLELREAVRRLFTLPMGAYLPGVSIWHSQANEGSFAHNGVGAAAFMNDIKDSVQRFEL